MVVLRCANCKEVIIDTIKGINRVVKIDSYKLVAKTDIGEFGLDLEPDGVEYKCEVCGNTINTKKLIEKGYHIEVLMEKAERVRIEKAKENAKNGNN